MDSQSEGAPLSDLRAHGHRVSRLPAGAMHRPVAHGKLKDTEMTEEYDRFCVEYWAAKDSYDEAERAFARARAVLTEAERIRKRHWDELVYFADRLPKESRKKVAAAQFCGAPR